MRRAFQGRGTVETCSRARSEAMGHGIQRALGVARPVRALGQGLAQQASRILVGAAWPGAVRIGTDALDRQSLGPRRVLDPRVSSIVRQGFPQPGGHRPELCGPALAGTRGIGPVHPGQADQACGPRHQGPDGRPMAGAREEIAVPVARHRAGPHLGGTPGHWRHRGDLAPSIRSPRPRPSCGARRTHRRQPCAPQRAAGPHLAPHLDRLGRALWLPVVRRRASTAPGHLCRRAALGHRRPHVRPAPRSQAPARVCAVRRDRGGRASCCGPPHGSPCGARGLTPAPSSAATGRGAGPGSRAAALTCVEPCCPRATPSPLRAGRVAMGV